MRNDLAEDLKRILTLVDRHYQSYHKLTNDELREVSSKLERTVSCSDDKNIILDAILPEAFALVKETARRFSLGSIEVRANELDCLLSEETDFVKINGDKAVYLNRWDIGSQTVTWDIVYYDEQMMGGILLHRGYAVEMATGEGKTFVAMLPAFLNALTHQGVHIMTANDYLSKRDFLITRPIYLFHGLSVGCIELYGRNDERYKMAYNADITFGDNSKFIFDYLYDNLVLSPSDCVQRSNNYAIIDEVDSILIDNATEPHIIGGGNCYNEGKYYQKYFPIVKEFIEVSGDGMYIKNELQKTSSLTPCGKTWLEKRLGEPGLFDIEKTYQIADFDLLDQNRKDEIKERIHRQNVINQLLLALTVYNVDEDYIIENGKVIIIDQNTGRGKPKSRWEYGLHTAIEVKENVQAGYDYDSTAVISIKNYFKLYGKICGMSGTIMTVADEFNDIYGLKCEILPTHKPVIRKDESLRVYHTAEKKNRAILERIRRNFNNGRPSLVSSTSIVKSNRWADLLYKEGFKFAKLDAKSVKDEALIVSKAGIGNTITISTNMAGRGTDIKPSPEAIESGGLDVISTDIFNDVRIDNQLRGRAGRQGNPGSSAFFASLDDQVLKFLNQDDIATLNSIAKTLSENELLENSEIRALFRKAQLNSSNLLYEQRMETSRKDDIVAPRRRKFYEQRYRLLFDDKVSVDIIQRLVDNGLIRLNTIEEHLTELYNLVKTLVIKSRSNNRDCKKVSIPFSDNRHLYTINIDIRKTCVSYEYFRKEYVRQMILQVYDSEWKKFVSYMMGDLDEHEVDMLDEKFNKLLKDVDSIIGNRLTNATIPIGHGGRRPSNGDGGDNERDDSVLVTAGIHPNSLCPCGSGKEYCECHGKDTHNTRRRR